MELKEKAHPCYELVRSLNLCGPLPESTEPKDTPPPRLSVGLRVCLFGLRWCVSQFSAFLGFVNLWMVGLVDVFLVGWDPILPTVPFELRLPFAVALMTPYSIVSILVARDMLRSESPLVVAVTIAIGCAGLPCIFFAFPQGPARVMGLFIMSGIVVFWSRAARFVFTPPQKKRRYYTLDMGSWVGMHKARSRVTIVMSRIYYRHMTIVTLDPIPLW